jgi:hypothetical protein
MTTPMQAPATYRKRPVQVNAIRWTGDNWDAICAFLDVPDNGHGDEEALRADPDRMPVLIHTLEGDMRAELGDWIVEGVHGEFYPVKPEIFAETYDHAPDHPVGAVIEIIERRRQTEFEGIGGEVLIPTDIRINGQRLLTPKDSVVTVHAMEFPARDAVKVTFTAFARRVLVDAEDMDVPAPGRPRH